MCEGNINRLPLTCPQLGTWPATQACALAGNQTGNFSVHSLALNLLSHTSQVVVLFIYIFMCMFFNHLLCYVPSSGPLKKLCNYFSCH